IPYCLEFGEADAPRRSSFARGAIRERLKQRVRRRGYPVETSEQDNLAVQIIALDGSETACQALPGRTAAAPGSLNRTQCKRLLAFGKILFVAGHLDAGRSEARVGFPARFGEQGIISRVGSTERFDGISQVADQLSIFEAHHVRTHFG